MKKGNKNKGIGRLCKMPWSDEDSDRINYARECIFLLEDALVKSIENRTDNKGKKMCLFEKPSITCPVYWDNKNLCFVGLLDPQIDIDHKSSDHVEAIFGHSVVIQSVKALLYSFGENIDFLKGVGFGVCFLYSEFMENDFFYCLVFLNLEDNKKVEFIIFQKKDNKLLIRFIGYVHIQKNFVEMNG